MNLNFKYSEYFVWFLDTKILDKNAVRFVVHSNSKFRIFATETFRSDKSTEISDYFTKDSGEINETFESVSISPKFVFGKIYILFTKLRDFHRNISDICQ
jgi:hypothetical protein